MITGRMSEFSGADGSRWIEVVVIISVYSPANAPIFLVRKNVLGFEKREKYLKSS